MIPGSVSKMTIQAAEDEGLNLKSQRLRDGQVSPVLEAARRQILQDLFCYFSFFALARTLLGGGYRK